jgi:hypothetical protein
MDRKHRRAHQKRGRVTHESIQNTFAAAVGHHQAGRLNEAIRIYGEVLAASPRHADSFHLLGVAASHVNAGQNP